MFQRRKDASEVGQAILRPGLRNDGETVGPFAAQNRSLPFAVAAVERENRLARGQPQHIAEIISLVVVKRDRLARRKGGIDKQPRRTKIVLRHGRGSISRGLLTQSSGINAIIDVRARPTPALLQTSTGSYG